MLLRIAFGAIPFSCPRAQREAKRTQITPLLSGSVFALVIRLRGGLTELLAFNIAKNGMRSSPGGKLRHMKTNDSPSKKRKKTSGPVTIGVDIGDQWSHYCTLSQGGEVIEEGRFRTTAAPLAKHFADIDSVRIAIENGTHSIWINEQLCGYGHEVIVANVRELHAICRNDRKSDRVDAEKLARFARLDPNVLRPITHRSVALLDIGELLIENAPAAIVACRFYREGHLPQARF